MTSATPGLILEGTGSSDRWCDDGGHDRGDTVDVVSDIATPLAFESLMLALGADGFDRETVLELSDSTFARIRSRTPDDAPDNSPVQIASWQQADTILEPRKRGGTGPGVVADAIIAHAEPDADGWRLDRLARGIRLLAFVAPGLDTVRHTVSNAFDAIIRFPQEWERVRTGDVTPESFVEEVLRFESAVQGFFRGAREEIHYCLGAPQTCRRAVRPDRLRGLPG